MTRKTAAPHSRFIIGCLAIFVLFVNHSHAKATHKHKSQKKLTNSAHKRKSHSKKEENSAQNAKLDQDKKKLVLFGVEHQRKEDKNRYDTLWANRLKAKKPYLIVYKDKEDFLEGVKKLTQNGDCIKELNLYGHGTYGFFGFGNGLSDDLKRSTFIAHQNYYKPEDNDWKTVFEPIKGKFCKDGARLNLYGCYVGGKEEGAVLLFELADYFKATVCAPVDVYYANRKYENDWQEATPFMKKPPQAIKPKFPLRATRSQQ